jgi:multidrug efflux pump subunit AcrB
MLIAVIAVSALITITLGRRESLIVFTAIPVTLACSERGTFIRSLAGGVLRRLTTS